MGFDRNPHVAKATAAEQKARDAGDVSARAMAWREAARQWERAADREMSDKRKTEYNANAERARESADEAEAPEAPVSASTAPVGASVKSTPPSDPRGFN